MQQLSVWVGSGLITAGVSAALLAGAGVAGAETGSAGDSGGSGSTSSDTGKQDPKNDEHSDPNTKPDDSPGTASNTAADEPDPAAGTKDDVPTDETTTEPDSDTDDDAVVKTRSRPTTAAAKKKVPAPAAQQIAAAKPAVDPEPQGEVDTLAGPIEQIPTSEPVVTVTEPIPAPTANRIAAQSVSSEAVSSTRLAQVAAPANTTPVAPSLLGFVGSVIGGIVASAGSIAFTALQAVEALAAGPPVLPPNSTVTVRSSSLVLSTGQKVAANWYFPEGDVPPDRMILLQHGFLALGPMYSYTAANLAERTNSIIVTPTLPSNPFLGDHYWLGGTGMADVIADLFVGDRPALTASALAAGYETQYDFGSGTPTLPQKFAMAGHSLGGQLVSGTAGFLAENGAADDLVGVITLDGVPTGTVMPDALAKLDAYEQASGKYVPIREIGAPPNLYNSFSNVKESLTSARPDHFNGVVLTGGVHMDSMRGGNPLIQFAAYVAAGFPQPQNPPAVEELAVQWLADWFNGKPFAGDAEFLPGTTIPIQTTEGLAHGVVIGNPPVPAVRGSVTFGSTSPTTIPAVNPALTSLAA